MNKDSNKYLIFAAIGVVLIFVLCYVYIIKPTWEDYQTTKISANRSKTELEGLNKQYESTQDEQKREEMQLQSIKQIYPADKEGTADNLAVYGDAFSQILNCIKRNHILVRSIEYRTTPDENPLVQQFGDRYNVCEIKFFLVSTYEQLKVFFKEVSNDTKYLISISNVTTQVFEENTDYILSNVSLTLYSKKKEEQKQAPAQKSNQPFNKK